MEWSKEGKSPRSHCTPGGLENVLKKTLMIDYSLGNEGERGQALSLIFFTCYIPAVDV